MTPGKNRKTFSEYMFDLNLNLMITRGQLEMFKENIEKLTERLQKWRADLENEGQK